VSFSLLVDSGYSADQGVPSGPGLSGQQGAAALVSKLLDQGTKTRSSLEIGEQLAQLGATLNVSANMDGIDARLSALKANLDASLAIFADVTLNPSFPQADFLREQKQQLATIEREKDRARAVGPARSARPDLRQRASLLGTLDRLGHRRQRHPTHARGYGPIPCRLVQAQPRHADRGGRHGSGEMKPKLEKLFSAWTPGETPKKNVATVALPERSVVYLMDRPGAQQSLILAGNVAPPKNTPAEVSIESMERHSGRRFRRPAEHEPARGQALGVWGGDAAHERARPAAIPGLCARTDR